MIPTTENSIRKDNQAKEANYHESLKDRLRINAEKKIKGVFLAKTRSINLIVDLF